MRDLTPEELKLAPEWATHYSVDEDDDVLFESTNGYQWLIKLELSHKVVLNGYSVELSKPIRAFDIGSRKFSDDNVRLSSLCKENIEFAVDDCGLEHYFTQNREDVIAMAKALGVTAEDLK